jgi:ABC-type transport system involved in multi-copper enzyme maturation permease subunit
MRYFGPVLLYDMIRTARRWRFILVRILYALFLGFIFFMAYQSAFAWRYRAAEISPQELARFAEQMFLTFMVLQLIFVILLTPAYVAGAIAEEKERRTLEFMLTTDLFVSEILLSKLVSRLANVTLFILAGLPIISLIQLFGGVNPQWLWFSFGTTAMVAVSLSSVSMWASVHGRKPRQAIIVTYLLIAGYFLVWLLLLAGYGLLFQGTQYPRLNPAGQAYVWMLEIYQSGNPIYAWMRATGEPSFTGLNRKPSLGDLALYFVAFHAVLTVGCLLHSVWRLRAVYMKQTYATPKKENRRWFFRKRKPVYQPPMLWKELHGDAPRMGWVGRIMYFLTIVACAIPLIVILVEQSRRGVVGRAEPFNFYVRVVGAAVAVVTFFFISLRAATAIGSERDRETLDSLLSTPLTDRDILKAKWISSIYGAWPMYLLLAAIWGGGLVTGGLSLFALPFLFVAMACYCAFAASHGLMWGAGAKTTTRALVWCLSFILIWAGAHWFNLGRGTLVYQLLYQSAFSLHAYGICDVCPGGVYAALCHGLCRFRVGTSF